jgi:cation:H+ antiporter
MLLEIFTLIGGFVALIIGADKLVEGASSLAAKLGVSDIVIGLTIVAFGTSAPELVVNVYAALNKSTDMILGNVVGSNLFNTLAILGICSLIYPLKVKKSTTWLEIPLALLAALAVLITANDLLLDGTPNYISRTDGYLLMLFFAIFLVYNIIIARKGKTKEAEVPIEPMPYWKAGLFVLLGMAGLVVGGKLIVSSAVAIAQAFALSERIIGLTIVSIGTSLPELATSLAAVRKRNVDIAIGNVVGSNIFNIFWILGLSTIIYPVKVNPAANIDIVLNIVASFLLFIFIFTGRGRQLERWEGAILVAMYVAYTSYLVYSI